MQTHPTVKQLLFLAGGWEGHQPHRFVQLVGNAIAAPSVSIQIETSLDILVHPEHLQSFSAIFPCWTMGTLIDAQGAGLQTAIRAGVGLAGIHGGMGDAFRGNIDYEWMTGGHFVGHPFVGEYKVRIKDRRLGITKDFPDSFDYESEQYYMLVDPCIDIVADADYTFEGRTCSMPIAWTKMWGKGRVFFSALGHDPQEYERQPLALELAVNGFKVGSRNLAMNHSKTKIGIVGCGNISKAYFESCGKFENLEIAACADMDAAKAEAAAATYKVRGLTVFDIINTADIDLIVNLTVPQAHAEIDILALSGGKHVFSEKPFSLTLNEGFNVINTASSARRRVGCAPDTVLGAAVQTSRHALDSGEIGEPISFTAIYQNGGHESWHPAPEFYYQKGGGPMFDMGPYYLHALITLLGPVKKVTGMTKTYFCERTITSQPKSGQLIKVDVPTHVTSLLEFHSGVLGTLITSFDVAGARGESFIELFGTKGTLRVPDPNNTGGTVQMTGPDGWREVPHTHGYAQGSRGLGVSEMAAAIRTGRPHRANGEIALHAVEIMEAIHRSSDSGRHIELGTTCERPEAMRRDLPEYVLE